MHNRRFDTFEEFEAACAPLGYSPAFVLSSNFPLHGHLIPDMVKRGYNVNALVAESSNMLHFACDYHDAESIAVLVAFGADPSIRRHNADVYDILITGAVSFVGWRRSLDAVISVYPEGLRRESNGGKCPIDTAIRVERLDIVRVLVEAGCPIDSQTMKLAVSAVDNPRNYESTLSKNVCRYLVEHGGRIGDEPDPDFIKDGKGYKFYLSVVAAVERCIGAAVIIIGLSRVGGRVHGNGRDALRLVAREVLKSKSFNDWHGKMDWLEKRMKKF